MKSNKTKPDNPLDEVRQFIGELKQLARARSSAEKNVNQAEAKLSAVRRTLADSQAEALMKDPDCDLDNDSAESSEYVTASLRTEQARAALGGVMKAIRERDVQLLTVSERLRAEREQRNKTVLAEFIAQERPVIEAYAAFQRRATALEAALQTTIDEAHALPECGDWHEDREAQRLHEQHSDLQRLSKELEGFRRDAESRTIVAERSRMRRASFDPGARYEVIRPFQCYGRSFAPLQVVDRHSIDLRLLGQLYDSKRLRLLEPKDLWSEAPHES